MSEEKHPVEALIEAAEHIESCCPADVATSRRIDDLHDARLAVEAWLAARKEGPPYEEMNIRQAKKIGELQEALAREKSVAREALGIVKKVARQYAGHSGEAAASEIERAIDAQLARLEESR